MTTFEDERDDSAAVLVDPDGPPVSNGKITNELDPKTLQPTGFKLFVPTEDEQKRMETRIAEECEYAEDAYKPIWSRMRSNILAYEALPDGGSDDFMALPYGKRDVNHLVGFFVNRIYNKNPIASVIPEEYGQYEVPVPRGRDPLTGQTLSEVQLRSAEEIVAGGERLMEHYLRGPKLKFHDFTYNIIMSAVQGAPPWGKTCYERVLRPQLVPKWRREGDRVVVDGYTEVERVVASPHKLVAQSGFSVMMASPWLDVQEAEMVFEHVPITIAEGRQKIHGNEWYLCTDEDWEKVRKSATSLKHYESFGARDERQRRDDGGRKFLDIFNVWLYWPIIFADEDGEDTEGIFSLVVPWDRTTGKILGAPLNPYAHGMRNLVNYIQRPRPFEMSGYSTMEDVLPLQKVGTRLWHSQIQNAMLANTVIARIRPGSSTWQWMKQNELRARSKVPVTAESDFRTEVMGRDLRSLAPEMGAVDTMSKQLTVSDTVKGATLLGRTSRAAISLVQEAGLTVPNMDLDFFRDRFSLQLTMLFRNFGQWSALGEEIPFRDPETRALVMKAVEFPIDGNNQFSVRITASSDEETAQFEFERDLGLSKLQGETYVQMAQIIAPMLNPTAPPVVEAFQKPMLVATNVMLARIFELAKMDPKKFTLSERQIDEILAQHKDWVIQEQRRKQEEAIAIQTEAIRRANRGGGGAVVQGAFGGGGATNAVAPNPAGASAVGGASGNAGLPAPSAVGGI